MTTATPPIDERWALTDLFADDAAFAMERDRLRAHLPRLAAWSSRLVESAGVLADALDAVGDARRRFAALRCYGMLRGDGNLADPVAQALRREVDLLATEFSDQTSYLRPEILALEPDHVENCVKDEPRLAPYAYFLRDLMRQREHVLEPGEERILAQASLLTGGPSGIFEVLNDLELPRKEITLSDGESVRLTPVAFSQLRSNPDRGDRRLAFENYFAAYSQMRETLAQNVYGAVKSHVFRARTRRYDSCLSAALSPDNVPTTVYRNLIDQVRSRLPVLHRYFRLRARMLGVETLEYHDLYCPLISQPARRFDTGAARDVVLTALEPLGSDYVAELKRGFESRWVDWHPGDGKRSGAYATGWAYDTHPFVLVNFLGDYESVSTLAHEMGHAMHSFYSNRTQPFASSDYSIFVAEVASTLNEALVNRHLQEQAATDHETTALISSQLDGIRGTLFRQTMFAEFELAMHERVERGEVLTGEILSEIYLGLLRDYHGHEQGVVQIDERYGVEWAGIPHMYFDFYVYQYATGIVAAMALSDGLLNGPDDARARYLKFLSSGGSNDPLELLRVAGVDLESEAPFASAFTTIERRLDRLDELNPDQG